MGRLVKTHSTYIDGLIPKLKVLAKSTEIKTITPGVIKRTKSNVSGTKFRISTVIQGGYKVIARKGNTVQEVFVITKMESNELLELLNLIVKRK